MPKRAVAPAGVSGVSWAIKASRSASTSLICASSNSRRSSSLQISAFRCFDSGRPSPVRSASRRWRRSRFTGSYPRIPCVKSSPFMRLTWKTRSAIRVFRSRPIRRLSSSSGVRSLTIEQARGSPRFHAIRARISVSPSMRSVFARRWRRGMAMDAASTMWLSIQASLLSTRPNQKPSSPASWMITIG
ncbi:hypothetical protein SAMN05216459_1392 [Ensifer sp. OV372]|nr:hypothetical protein SAMN05216459_1392 [Ensifer sp. OV372]